LFVVDRLVIPERHQIDPRANRPYKTTNKNKQHTKLQKQHVYKEEENKQKTTNNNLPFSVLFPPFSAPLLFSAQETQQHLHCASRDPGRREDLRQCHPGVCLLFVCLLFVVVVVR
jgi:hypothetical protein